ncbi:hypothetical protein CRENBAI_007045 [Crenichthys baileyi]|uniref:Uncharacterized protein n=1 Tax=Crenichthys baileyi TaxID=28760 RepID=A0AAV9RTT6_9TELE
MDAACKFSPFRQSCVFRWETHEERTPGFFGREKFVVEDGGSAPYLVSVHTELSDALLHVGLLKLRRFVNGSVIQRVNGGCVSKLWSPAQAGEESSVHPDPSWNHSSLV